MNNIIEGNKLIAEFMGYEVLPIKEYDLYPLIKGSGGLRQTRYNSSWDWLMPVVEKIGEMGVKFVIGDGYRVTVYKKDYDWRNGSTSDSMLECVWHGCTQFIKWYNNQKQ